MNGSSDEHKKSEYNGFGNGVKEKPNVVVPNTDQLQEFFRSGNFASS
jgi:hypothetical protein